MRSEAFTNDILRLLGNILKSLFFLNFLILLQILKAVNLFIVTNEKLTIFFSPLSLMPYNYGNSHPPSCPYTLLLAHTNIYNICTGELMLWFAQDNLR